MKRSRLLPGELRGALSPLESRVLGLLSPAGARTVRDVHGRLGGDAALTSVAVTLDRLHKMGLVERRAETCRGGIRYRYTARTSPRDFEKRLVESTVDNLIERFGPAALAYFEERFGKRRR